MEVIDKTDAMDQIKERLIKAVSSLDKALSKKLLELDEVRKNQPVVDIKKFEQAIAEKAAEAEAANKKVEALEKEIARLLGQIEEEKSRNEKLVKFGSDISDKVEGMVKQLELVINS